MVTTILVTTLWSLRYCSLLYTDHNSTGHYDTTSVQRLCTASSPHMHEHKVHINSSIISTFPSTVSHNNSGKNTLFAPSEDSAESLHHVLSLCQQSLSSLNYVLLSIAANEQQVQVTLVVVVVVVVFTHGTHLFLFVFSLLFPPSKPTN